MSEDRVPILSALDRLDPERWVEPLLRVLNVALVVAAVAYLLLYVGIALARIGYPFELEWAESHIVNGVDRILAGEDLYGEPGVDYVQPWYSPLYYYVSALAAWLVGPGFLPNRLVSFLFSLGLLLIVGLFVRKETGSWRTGLLSAGLFAGTYKLSGSWFDLGRVDSQFLLFLFAGFFLMWRARRTGTAAISGLCFAAAFLTKQSALVMALPAAAAYFLVDIRKALACVGALGLVLVISTLGLDIATEGWYSHLVWEVPTQLSGALYFYRFVEFWKLEVLGPLMVAVLLGVVFVFSLASEPRRFVLSLAITAGITVGCLYSRMHHSGYVNVLMPLHLWLAVLFGLGLGSLRAWTTRIPKPRDSHVLLMAGVAAMLQFALLVYNPFSVLPDSEDEAAGRRLIGRLSEIEGPIFMPSHTYYPVLAGHATSVNYFVFSHVGVYGDAVGPVLSGVYAAVQDSIEAQHFSTVIVDNHKSDIMGIELRPWYVPAGSVFDNPDVFWPVTGKRTRPEVVWVRNPDSGSTNAAFEGR